MIRYTASDFCQGHGGGTDCPSSPEVGCLNHDEDFDHGVISYCDGTCAEAQEHFSDHLRHDLRELPVVSTESIALTVYGHGLSYTVTFEGVRAEALALAYLAARGDLHFSAVADRPFSFDAFPRISDALYPICHHGLSLGLCMDPYGDGHFGTREQELAGW